MPSIHLLAFQGMRPRANRALLKGNEARWAENVNLWHGTIEGYKMPRLVQSILGDAPKTIFKTDAGWLAYPRVDDFVTGLPGCPRVIAAGEDFNWPVWASAADAVAGNWRRLGLPVPASPSAFAVDAPTFAGPDDQSSELRAYFITYTDSFGNEGPPSLPSLRFNIDDGHPATVTIPPAPFAGGWDIASVRLYRLTGTDAGAENVQLPKNAVAVLIDEFSPNITEYTDSLKNVQTGEPLVTTKFAPPPLLTHIVAEPNGTELAGAVGRDVFFCEPHEYHAWPDKYKLTLDDTIIAMAWTTSGLYVVTDGHPYWIASQPDEFGQREVFRMPESLPCTARRSLCQMPDGTLMYAHDDGLVLLSGRSASVVSQGYWGEDDFKELRPDTMLAAVYDGMWHGFSANSGWMLDLVDNVYPGSQLGLIAQSLRPTALHRARTDGLYMALPGGIFRWNDGDTYMPWRYRSRLNVTPGHMNWAAGKVVWDMYAYKGDLNDARPITTFRLLTDDRTRYTRTLQHSNPFRLPHLSRHLDFEIELERAEAAEKGAIREIHVASSVTDLTEAGD